ncbi:MAG: TetR/AcrR family transcriptional regulator [Chitinophagales bacterium]|nr:TetR/AcrR family transcriptional regulator [Chitinophagales bacterium]
MQSTKENIRSCAARLFRKKGYKATSMRDIAEEVGIKAASIYNHISSKQELFSELLLQVAHLFTKGMKDINTSSLSAEEKLEKLIALHIHLTAEYTDSISLIAGEWVHLEEPARTQYINLRNDYENQFRNILDAGKEEGIIKNLDTEIILFSILSTLRWLYTWYSRNKHYNLNDLEQQMINCLIDGVKN